MMTESDRKPAHRYCELPDETRDYLERLQPRDLEILAAIINAGRSAKWLALAFGGLLGAIVLVKEAWTAVRAALLP